MMSSFSIRSALRFDSAETRAQVAIHQGALKACSEERLLQVIKEDGLVRPVELLLFEQKFLPAGIESRIFERQGRLGAVAQKHLTHDRLETPQTALLAKIDTLETAGVILQVFSEQVEIFVR